MAKNTMPPMIPNTRAREDDDDDDDVDDDPDTYTPEDGVCVGATVGGV